MSAIFPDFSRCVHGYEGAHCETNIDDCAIDVCRNGGLCIDGVANFTCQCAEGWTGDNCTIDISECTINPCLQDGICIENSSPPGFKYGYVFVVK